MMSSKSALKRQAADQEESSLRVASPQNPHTSHAHPDDSKVWEHDVPSDDEVFTHENSKKARSLTDQVGACGKIEELWEENPSNSHGACRDETPKRSDTPRPITEPLSRRGRPATVPITSGASRIHIQRRGSSGYQVGDSPTSGPKKAADVVCWLEGEYLRRDVPRVYRKCILVDGKYQGEPLISIYTVLRIETAVDPTDQDSVLWQPIKKGGAVLNARQWQALVRNVEKVNASITQVELQLAQDAEEDEEVE